jgi:hypothetical protein
MPRNQQFEIPQELRQLAEDNVEHARKLYLQFMEGISQAWLTSSADRAPPGFNESAGDKNHARECGCRLQLGKRCCKR